MDNPVLTSDSDQSVRLPRGVLLAVFFLLEALVFAILPLSERYPIRPMLSGLAVLTGLLLIAALLLRRSPRGKAYWMVAYVLFVAGVAILVSVHFSGSLQQLLHLSPTNPQGIAAAKLIESVLRVGVILLLVALAGVPWSSLYLHKGRLWLALGLGSLGFLALAGVAFLPLLVQPGIPRQLLPLTPWILIFIFSNAFMEELLYRGLFLKPFAAFLGPGLANLLIAMVFTLIHIQVNYVADIALFLVGLFPLALLWGYLIQKTNTLWGAVLFHAGADCLIILPIFAGLL
jgi:membrane protease YdiL (CAAX protease family)